MAASVLNTKRSIDVSVFVVRAFIRLREMVSTHKELAAKFKELEKLVGEHDQEIFNIVQTIRQLMQPPPPKPKHKMGF